VRVCSNLDLIKTLKDEVEELRSKEAMHERSMFAIAQASQRSAAGRQGPLTASRNVQQP